MKQNKGKYDLDGEVNDDQVVVGSSLQNVENGPQNNDLGGGGGGSTVEIPLEDLNEANIQQKESQEEEETPQRQQWDKPIEFLLSCIAMSVGLGNIWRFPYIAFENGGGAFLIPYIIVLFLVGKPIYFLELCIGQFCSKGSCKVWQMVPFFKGIGYGATFGSVCVLSFYCALMALTLRYFITSFWPELPWTVCDNDWPDVQCEYVNATQSWMVIGKSSSIPELYLKHTVYKELDNIDHGLGTPDWKLSLCLLGSWIAIFFSLIKGVQSAGKVAYFTAIFPYAVLIIFFIRGVTLEKAWDGIKYFIVPQWEKLLETKVWVEALKQCFFSISIGFGPVKEIEKCYKCYVVCYIFSKDAMVVSFMDTGTSLLAGVTTFSVLGNLAHRNNQSVADVVKGGPDAIASFPAPQLFSVLFFLMMLTLGVGSASSLAGGIITVIHDKFPSLDKKIITTAVSIFGFSFGLIYITPGAGSVLYVIVILEMTGMIFVYGLPNIVRDIQFMLQQRISWYWQICWALTPFILTSALIYELSTSKPFSYNKLPYPKIAVACGWMLVAIAISMLPLFALHGVFQQEKEAGFFNKLKQSFKPLKEWGPLNSSDRLRWEHHKSSTARRPSLAGRFFIHKY